MKYKEARKITNIVWSSALCLLVLILLASNIAIPAGDKLSILGYRPIVVVSGSMLPTMQINSISLMKYCDVEDVKVGDIVMYYHPARNIYITHRAIEKITSGNNTYIHTQGDANSRADGIDIDDTMLVGKIEYIFNWTAWYLSYFVDESSPSLNDTKLVIVTSLLLTLVWTITDFLLTMSICGVYNITHKGKGDSNVQIKENKKDAEDIRDTQ